MRKIILLVRQSCRNQGRPFVWSPKSARCSELIGALAAYLAGEGAKTLEQEELDSAMPDLAVFAKRAIGGLKVGSAGLQ
jgi:hypothetical protein